MVRAIALLELRHTRRHADRPRSYRRLDFLLRGILCDHAADPDAGDRESWCGDFFTAIGN
jgi:diadenosine tetraphosphatase ApaH/serine/threonine PP2A family protein phosphatase